MQIPKFYDRKTPYKYFDTYTKDKYFRLKNYKEY